MPNRETLKWRHFHEDKQPYEQQKELRRARRQLKANRKPKGAGSRAEGSELSGDDEGLPASERVMPRGERERRAAIQALALQALAESADGRAAPEAGAQPGEAAGAVPGDGMAEPSAVAPHAAGVVVEVGSGVCRVRVDGAALVCGLRGSLSAAETGFTNVIAVGDEVLVAPGGGGRGIVEAVLPRRSALTRPDVFLSHLQQVIVANADQVLAVAAWREPDLWFELLDRYLIAAQRSHLRALICINKVDLAAGPDEVERALAPYVKLGYRVLLTSAASGQGIAVLRAALAGQTTVLAGLSGVGKSSLLAALEPGLALRTTAVNAHSGHGRHTTTGVTLLPLAGGGYVADTPGIREFGLAGLARAELLAFYPDLAPHAAACRFADCSHRHEPDCAVRAALERGEVAAARVHSYHKIWVVAGGVGRRQPTKKTQVLAPPGGHLSLRAGVLAGEAISARAAKRWVEARAASLGQGAGAPTPNAARRSASRPAFLLDLTTAAVLLILPHAVLSLRHVY